MKVLILVCLIFASGCQGCHRISFKEALNEVEGAFTVIFNQVEKQAKDVGQGLLDDLRTSGTQLAGQSL